MPEKPEGLRFGPLSRRRRHICVDMQRMFAEKTDWQTPWMKRIAPVVTRLATLEAERTIFTRFIPAARAGEGPGSWRRYYERWASMTLESLDPAMLRLLPELEALCPPARIFNKRCYSPWVASKLHSLLRLQDVDTLIISGGETDVCVLGAVMGAVDLGYRVVIAVDAVCSSSDETHDATLKLYARRYSMQIETAKTDEIIEACRR